MFLYKHAFKCYNDSKERLFDKGNRKITYRKDGPIMKTTNAKSVQSDFTYPAGDPPPVVPADTITKIGKLSPDALKRFESFIDALLERQVEPKRFQDSEE